MIIAELDGRADRHGGLELNRLQLEDLELWLGDRVDLLLGEHLGVDIGDNLVERFFKQRTAADEALEHAAWRLTLAKTRDHHPIHQAPIGQVQPALDLFVIELNVEDDLAVLNPLRRNLHTNSFNPRP